MKRSHFSGKLAFLVLGCACVEPAMADLPLNRQVRLYGPTFDVATNSLSLSSDGRYLAFSRKPYTIHDVYYAQDMTFVDLRSGESQIIEHLFGPFFPQPTWSPDGRFLAYLGITEDQVRLRVWDRSQKREIFASQESASADSHESLLKNAAPRWSADGRFVLYLAHVDLVNDRWAERGGVGADIRLTAELRGKIRSPSGVVVLSSAALDSKVATQLRWAQDHDSANRYYAKRYQEDSRHVVALDLRDGTSRVIATVPADAPVDLATYEASLGIVTRSAAATEAATGCSDKPQPCVGATQSDTVVYLRKSAVAPPELWRIDLRDKDQRATSLRVVNPGPSPRSTTREVVQWKNQFGESFDALLSLPAGADRRAAPLPVVVDFHPSYPMEVPDPQQFDGGGSQRYDQLRTQGGYAILKVRFPLMREGRLYRSDVLGHVCDYIAASAVAALDAGAKTGWIDANRAGVLGHSYGGYAVNCLVTRTARFRAAVSGSGLSDWASAFADISGLSFGRMPVEGLPWEVPERYTADSPVYHLNRVSTPLLLYYGKTEPTVADQQQEMFFGLKNLGKPALLLGYDAGDHGSMFDMPDFWDRVISWFDTYLKPDSSAATGERL